MRPTDERGRPIGASPGGLPAGDRGDPVGPRRAGGHAAGFTRRPVSISYRPYKLAFCSLGRREAFFKGFPCVGHTVVYLRLKVSFFFFFFF